MTQTFSAFLALNGVRNALCVIFSFSLKSLGEKKIESATSGDWQVEATINTSTKAFSTYCYAISNSPIARKKAAFGFLPSGMYVPPYEYE